MLELETAIRQFESHLINDRNRNHLSLINFLAMQTQLNSIKAAARDLDLDKIKKAYNKLYFHCDYSPALQSKWTLLGLALGAFIETMALVVLSVAIPASIPAWAWVLNCAAMSSLGALLGYKIAEYQAKWEMHGVIYKAIDYLHTQDNHEMAQELTATVPWIYRVKHSLFSHPSDNKNHEPLEMDELSP